MRLDLLQKIKKEPLQKDLLSGIKTRLAQEEAEKLPASTIYTVLILVGLLLFSNVFFIVQNVKKHKTESSASLITNITVDNQLYR